MSRLSLLKLPAGVHAGVMGQWVLESRAIGRAADDENVNVETTRNAVVERCGCCRRRSCRQKGGRSITRLSVLGQSTVGSRRVMSQCV